MLIDVHSRQTIGTIDPDCPFIVISIFDSRSYPPVIGKSTNCIGILQLCFDDVCHDFGDIEGEICITPKQGKLIADFVLTYKNRAELIICQCEAGISRSAGAAAAISDYLGEDSTRFYKNSGGPNGYFIPNKIVYWSVTDGFLGLKNDNFTQIT